MFRRVVGALGVVLLASCTSSGVFSKDAFHNKVYPYTIGYTDPKDRSILGPDWLVENYFSNDDGVPTGQKTDDGYRKDREIELANGEKTLTTVDVFDVLLAHKTSSGIIWLRTIPVSPRAQARNLRVVAEEYAEALSGRGFFARDLGRFEVSAKEFASRFIEGHEAVLAGMPAYDATIEVANVDQLKLDSTNRVCRIRVVFARTPFNLPRDRPTGDDLPVQLMAGYVNNPTDFDREAPAFEKFLGLLETGGMHGLKSLQPASPAAPPAASVSPGSALPPAPPPAASAAQPRP